MQFDPSELLADAAVRAGAEGQVIALGAGDVEALGMREGGGVPVGVGVILHDALAGADGVAADVDVLQSDSALGGVGDGEVAQHLLYGIGDDARVVGAAMGELFLPRTRERLQYLFTDLDSQLVTDLAIQLHGGMIALLTHWLVDGEHPLRAEEFADRLLRVQYFLVPAGELDDGAPGGK